MTVNPNSSAALVLLAVICLQSPATAAEDNRGDGWEFSIRPYLWLAGVSGTLGASDSSGTSVRSSIDTGYKFLSLENLDMAAFLGLAAHKGRWSIETDMLYISFSDSPTVGPVTTDINLDGGSVALSAAYEFASIDHTEVIFGARLLRIDQSLDIMPGPQVEQGKTWTDPIVGLRYTRPLGERWNLLLRGDVGGFGVSSDWTFNGVAGASYNFTQRSSLFFGYRYLTFEFKEGDFISDLTIEGYAIGYQFRF